MTAVVVMMMTSACPGLVHRRGENPQLTCSQQDDDDDDGALVMLMTMTMPIMSSSCPRHQPIKEKRYTEGMPLFSSPVTKWSSLA